MSTINDDMNSVSTAIISRPSQYSRLRVNDSQFIEKCECIDSSHVTPLHIPVKYKPFGLVRSVHKTPYFQIAFIEND